MIKEVNKKRKRVSARVRRLAKQHEYRTPAAHELDLTTKYYHISETA